MHMCKHSLSPDTVKFPEYSDTRKIAVIILKFEQRGSTVMSPKDAHGMANSVDPDLGLHNLPRHICLNTLGSIQ